MKATTIDQVIEALDTIIKDTKTSGSPMGYFAALYRKVTVSVKKGIADGYFEDGDRMEKLDVIFANRYLEAYTLYTSNEQPSQSWQLAFNNSKKYWPVVLQHLLWGMNAHINLDLGIAAAQVAPGEKIEGLKNDFDKINELLASLVNEVENEISQIWPTLKIILKLTRKVDDFLVNFSMKLARNGAWKFATELAASQPEAHDEIIEMHDVKVAKNGKIINPPNIIIRFIFGIIRLGEKGTVRRRITVLE